MSTQAIWQHIGITWSGVVGVIIATTVLYVLFTSLLRRVGPRLMAGGSTLSTALLTVLGALCARAMLGDSPTLFGAVTALATLFVLEAALGSLGRLSPLKRAPVSTPNAHDSSSVTARCTPQRSQRGASANPRCGHAYAPPACAIATRFGSSSSRATAASPWSAAARASTPNSSSAWPVLSRWNVLSEQDAGGSAPTSHNPLVLAVSGMPSGRVRLSS